MVAGRMEAQMVVPTGGASVSASIGAAAAAWTVTVPAGNYYLTEAGGVSSLLTVLQQQLNDNVQGYPQTAAAMQAAVGWGTWTAGWLLNEAASPFAAAFGAPSLTSVSSPIIGNTGPRAGVDKSVAFDSVADALTGGNVHDVIATDDLLLAAVIYPYSTTGSGDIVGKGFVGGVGAGYYLDREGSVVAFYVSDGVDSQVVTVAITAGAWYAVMAALDRSSNLIRLGVVNLSTGTVTVSSTAGTTLVGTLSNANSFNVGDNGTNRAISGEVAAVYVGKGTGAASGVVTNLSTALTNLRNAINDSWSLSFSTSTGLVTASGSFWPRSIAWTSTALRDVLGFAYDFDYPATPAQVTAALGGYGDFTSGSGWLCDESSGDLSPVFGSVTLADSGTPTYSNPGARGGGDKAVGFAAAADNFNGGNVLNPGAADDVLLVWAGRWTGALARDVLSKFTGAGGWIIYSNTTTSIRFFVSDVSVNSQSTTAAALPVGTPYVGIAALDRASSTMQIAIQDLTTGTQTLGASASTTTIGSLTNAAANLRMGNNGSVSNNGTGHEMSAWYITVGDGVAAGVPANIATALSNFAAYMKGQTSTTQARGLWLPGDFVNMDGDPRRAPLMSDARRTMSAIGQVLTLVGNTYRQHTNVRYEYVTADRVWGAEATYENGSWEEFVLETQLGQGSSWFKPGSAVQIYDHNDVQVGVDANVAGWYMVGVDDVSPKKAVDAYTGLWRIEIPMLVAVGS